jgi:outer membrane protein TolC
MRNSLPIILGMLLPILVRAEEILVEPTPLTLATAMARSLENVRTVQANVTTRTATVARFEALKHFIPMANLPQLVVGLNNVAGRASSNSIFPDITGGTPFNGPGLVHAELSRANLFFPLDPSGQITALPIAVEGIRAKRIMEELVRRSQVELAAQNYYESKRILYAAETAGLALILAKRIEAQITRKIEHKQAHELDGTQARADRAKAEVFVSEVEKTSRIAQRRLALVLHASRLLTPQETTAVPIRLEAGYQFDLADSDEVDLAMVHDLPTTREEAIEMARRKRLEVRLLVVGLNIARLQDKRDLLRLLGVGSLPLGLSFKNTTIPNGGPVTLGMIFGTLYDLPAIDIGLWSNIRRARLEVARSQLDLERALLEIEEDAGNSWDRWEQAKLEFEQRTREMNLAREARERSGRLLEQKQAIDIDVLVTDVHLSQARTNLWTGWFNLQLARLDILRSTESLLDYLRDQGIAPPQRLAPSTPPTLWTRLCARLGHPTQEP